MATFSINLTFFDVKDKLPPNDSGWGPYLIIEDGTIHSACYEGGIFHDNEGYIFNATHWTHNNSD